MNPLGGDDGGMGQMMKMARMMQGGNAPAALKQAGIAGIIADIINAQRMDVKRMGQEVDADISISQMTEDRAAEIVAGAIKGDLGDFARVFDELQAKRDHVLGEMLDEDEYDSYYRVRNKSLPRIGDDVESSNTAEDGDGDGGA